MSNLSKVVLLAAGGFAVSIILVVHMSQDADRKRLREGVRRDLERQKRKQDNITKLEQQQGLTRILEEQRSKT
jgi:protein PET117